MTTGRYFCRKLVCVDVTAELLSKIVIETIRRLETLLRVRVGFIVFDRANETSVRRVAKSVNGRADPFPLDGLESCEPCNILFLDYLPHGYFAKLSLGLYDDDFSGFLGDMILRGNRIVVMGDDPAIGAETPSAYVSLLCSYRRTLQSYGYSFPNVPRHELESNPPSTRRADASPEGNVYSGRVLCRRDLLENTRGGICFIRGRVLVTDLAAEAADAMQIEIRRL